MTELKKLTDALVKCAGCGHEFKIGQATNDFDFDPYLGCPNCQKVIETGDLID